ncbi:hypothetical protein [Streptomyces shenzhenensis]|uniref:Uncharacterized protein n=1 Tax=Streptomyces shenzhenensis TaxID=943815 RepID=A0A3M0HXE5_9ACTN|nr:hypothetical protein [Streptomyces shenzhenensis]RMB81265.1 hypothetical protein CTZ28_35250 [Streptomyces shenzhenensis]
MTVQMDGTPPGTQGRYGLCHWCRQFADDIRLVQVVEAGSGPCTAGNLFACGRCRKAHGLVPFADQP